MPMATRKYYEDTFKTLYGKMLRSTQRSMSALEISEMANFERTLETVPHSDLEMWTRDLIKDVTVE